MAKKIEEKLYFLQNKFLNWSTQLRQGLARVLEFIIIESKTANEFYEYITRKKCFWLKTVFKYRDLGRMKNS